MSFFLLPSTCVPGPQQMACDEALLLATGSDECPRLRFYYWPEPTISLGYFQEYDRFQSTFPNLSELTLVRRLTGGGAILHDREITYCLTIPAAHPLYKAGPVPAYVLVHQAIADVFKPFGIDLDLRPKNPDYARVRDEPEFCFSRPCPTDLIKVIAEELAKKLEVTFTPRDFTSEELDKTKTLIPKYTGNEWTIHRRT
jgi:lipoyl(octanoyl) transferase